MGLFLGPMHTTWHCDPLAGLETVFTCKLILLLLSGRGLTAGLQLAASLGLAAGLEAGVLLRLERLPVSDTRPLSLGNTTVHSASMTQGLSRLLPYEASMQWYRCMTRSQLAVCYAPECAHEVLFGFK